MYARIRGPGETEASAHERAWRAMADSVSLICGLLLVLILTRLELGVVVEVCTVLLGGMAYLQYTLPSAAAPSKSPRRAGAGGGGGGSGKSLLRRRGGGAKCAAGEEPVRRENRLVITVVAGRNLQARDVNLFAQSATSDPYVVCKLSTSAEGGEQQSAETEIRYRDLNPVWNQALKEFHVHDVERDTLELTIMDHDFGKTDDLLGTCSLKLSAMTPNRPVPVTLELHAEGPGGGSQVRACDFGRADLCTDCPL